MLELCVCIGSSCHIRGAYNVIRTFQRLMEEQSLHDRINFKSAFCQKQCRQGGVAVSVDGVPHRVSPEAAGTFFNAEVASRL